MASNLIRSLRPNTPLNMAGRLRWHEPKKRILDFGSDKNWLKFERKSKAKLQHKNYFQLISLIEPKSRNIVDDDFDYLARIYGVDEALTLLRSYILEAHLCNELVRLEVDFTKPLHEQFKQALKAKKSLARIKFQKLRKRLRKIQALHAIARGTPISEIPQLSPNAPNLVPALSLAAA